MKTIINNKMKKNGFAPVLILIVIAVLGGAFYIGYKNFSKSQSKNPEMVYQVDIIIPNIIDQWSSKIKWEKPTTDSIYFDDKNLTGSLRKGTITNPDLSGNPYSVDDLFPNKEINDLGWKESPPTGASGPLTYITRFSKIVNGESKILQIVIENITITTANAKCPCINSVTVFQEQ